MQVAIGRFSSRAEAEMARSLLDSVDIRATVRADDAGALHPELAQVGEKHGIALMVDEADGAAARELLDAVAAGAFATTAEDTLADPDPDPAAARVALDAGVAPSTAGREQQPSTAGPDHQPANEADDAMPPRRRMSVYVAGIVMLAIAISLIVGNLGSIAP
ncbi:MAG: DUF2007 domain-containing protein [Nitriliruptoraceae bacterium]|nr:DUF2007 domain-containing protein [Nitriliruptoraceae bacterium]